MFSKSGHAFFLMTGAIDRLHRLDLSQRPSSAPCCLIAFFRALMATADGPRDPAAWDIDQQRWYASLVAHCHGFERHRDEPDPQAVLADLSALPASECLQMVGDAALDGRVEDCNGRLWSTDRNGRWFATVDRKIVWLQLDLIRTACGQKPSGGGLVSHRCGICGCIRVQHLRVQSSSDDARDRHYHRARGAGQMRPDHVPKHLSISSPVSVMEVGRV